MTLIGTVPSNPQVLQAAVAARCAAGVTEVDDRLWVQPPADDAVLASRANTLAADGTVPEGAEATAKNAP